MSQGSSARPSTHGQLNRTAFDRGSQPYSTGCRVPKTTYSRPSGPPMSVCSSESARWTIVSPGRTTHTASSCQSSPEPPSTKKISSDCPCECGGEESRPGSTCTRLTPIPFAPAASPRACRVEPIGPLSRRRASTSSQCASTAAVLAKLKELVRAADGQARRGPSADHVDAAAETENTEPVPRCREVGQAAPASGAQVERVDRGRSSRGRLAPRGDEERPDSGGVGAAAGLRNPRQRHPAAARGNVGLEGVEVRSGLAPGDGVHTTPERADA